MRFCLVDGSPPLIYQQSLGQSAVFGKFSTLALLRCAKGQQAPAFLECLQRNP